MATSNSSNSIQVIRKAALLLDCLERAEDPADLSVAELAELMGEPRTSVYRLITTLDELGWIEPGSRRGTYRLGLKLFRLGGAVLRRFDVRQAALATMESIHEKTGDTVFLCVRRGREAVCIERIAGDRVEALALRLGGALPLHMGAAPRVLLAHENPEFQRRYIERVRLVSYTDRTLTSPDRLQQMLKEDRAAGYSISNEDVTPGIAAVGAPIFDHTGQVKAALSISGVASVILGDHAERTRTLIVEGAKEVSQRLGYELETDTQAQS